MERRQKVFCLLCKRSEETRITGPLSSKENVTAHEKCLIFSSGICTKDSPLQDDLFGFSVSDVLQEVKRGKKLKCFKCLKSGATAGCENKRCTRSFHYPCAMEHGAQNFEERKKGEYGIYCSKHQGSQSDSGSVNGRTSSAKKHAAPKNPSEAGAVKGHCLTCEAREENFPLDNLSSSSIMPYCEKHAPSSRKGTTGESSGAGPSVSSSDATSSNSAVPKRPLSSDDEEDVVRTKSRRRTTRDPFDSCDFVTNSGVILIPPIEDDDCEEIKNPPPDSALVREAAESPAGSSSNQGSGNQPEDESKGGDGEDDFGEESQSLLASQGEESQSLLASVTICSGSLTPKSPFTELSTTTKSAPESSPENSPAHSPVHSPDGKTAAPPVPLHSSTPPSSPASKPSTVTSPPPCPSSGTPSPEAPPPEQDSSPMPAPESEPVMDSVSFWKNCNAAGCTRAMFCDFMKEMNEISERIQTERASQTDYERALKVMISSGQLEKLVTEQQKELQRKQRELENAAAAMSLVVSALKR